MRRNEWFGIIWATLGVFMVISGVFSQKLVTIIAGALLALGYASAYLASYLKSDGIVKIVLEAGFGAAAVGVVAYGYIVTQNLVLGLMTVFITAMITVYFTLTHLLPRIHNKTKN